MSGRRRAESSRPPSTTANVIGPPRAELFRRQRLLQCEASGFHQELVERLMERAFEGHQFGRDAEDLVLCAAGMLVDHELARSLLGTVRLNREDTCSAPQPE